MKALDVLSAALFPPRCAFCGEFVLREENMLCRRCAAEIEWIDSACHLCGKSVEDCTCSGRKNEYSGVVGAFYYRGIGKRSVLRLKSKPSVAKRLGYDVAGCVRANYSDISFDFVTSVPMWRKTQRQKGFNHSEELARRTAENLSLPYFSVLEKIYKTEIQHKLSYSQRNGNVKGVFSVSDELRVRGSTILLIDDVKTTGATLNECALMLNLSGAKAVYAATAAVAYEDKNRE